MSGYPMVSGNVATIIFPPNTAIQVTATTNSPLAQQVTITDNNAVNLVFTGSGERTMIGQSTFSTSSPVQATFTYQSTLNQGWLNSVLNSGGPYVIGRSGFLLVVAENGDDTDYNDCVLQFSWRQ
jgi:Fucose-binding lectin II (PA-IIL)